MGPNDVADGPAACAFRGGGVMATSPKGHSPWAKFRVLCEYYADCIVASEKPEEVLFAEEEHRKFAALGLPTGWLQEAEAGNALDLSMDAAANHDLLEHLKSIKGTTESIYVGYPLQLFRRMGSSGMSAASPIFVIPASVSRFRGGQFRLELRLDEAKLNEAWMAANVQPEHRQLLMRRILRRDAEAKGMRGLFDLEKFCDYIERQKTRSAFSPKLTEGSIRWKLGEGNREFRNVAVLAMGSQLKYAKSLHRELRAICEMEDGVLDGTALAYVFREPPLPNVAQEGAQARIPASFIDTNLEQFRALLEGLNLPLSQVQGPPGRENRRWR